MKNPLNIPRLLAEIVATFALAQVAVMVILPLIAPGAWRETFRRVLEMNDGQIRFIGMAATLGGCALLLLD